VSIRKLASLIPRFLENRHHDVTSLLEAVNWDDFETARILGHSMKKGSGGGYGFDGITAIGSEIERAAKHSDPVALRIHIDACRCTWLAWNSSLMMHRPSKGVDTMGAPLDTNRQVRSILRRQAG
jgi:hypothetical protein